MNLPQKIRTLRKKKGMSQLEMAEALNVSRQAISGWEAGTSKPSIENLKYLSDFYDVSLDWLCSEDDTNDITDGKKGTSEYVDEKSENNESQSGNCRRNKIWILIIIIAVALVIFGILNHSTSISLLVVMIAALMAIVHILVRWISHIVIHKKVNKDGDTEIQRRK